MASKGGRGNEGKWPDLLLFTARSPSAETGRGSTTRETFETNGAKFKSDESCTGVGISLFRLCTCCLSSRRLTVVSYTNAVFTHAVKEIEAKPHTHESLSQRQGTTWRRRRRDCFLYSQLYLTRTMREELRSSGRGGIRACGTHDDRHTRFKYAQASLKSLGMKDSLIFNLVDFLQFFLLYGRAEANTFDIGKEIMVQGGKGAWRRFFFSTFMGSSI